MDIRLDGKVVLVTGGTKGIGKAIVIALAESGAHVAIHGNSSIKDALTWTRTLQHSTLHQANLADTNQTSNLISEVLLKHGRLDVLINNAGIAVSSGVELSDGDWMDDWNQTMAVNLNATGLLCKKAIQHFIKSKHGIIINIASRAAFRGDTIDYMAYAASKGGMVALTRSIARGYGKKGITAFNVAPGFTRTEMAEQFIKEYGEEYAAGDIALSSLTTPEDIAPLIVFLASGKGAHATGGTFDINAGSYVH